MDEQATTDGAGAPAEAQGLDTDFTYPELSPDELRQRLQQVEQESTAHRDQYLRSAAELKNYKRRVEQDRADLIRNAGASVLMKLIPILDDFDLAMAHVPAGIATSPWFDGVKLVQTKLSAVLDGEGVKPIEALGATFDPNIHEGVMHEAAGPELAGKVTAELRRGYTLHGRVLRPTMVKVGEG